MAKNDVNELYGRAHAYMKSNNRDSLDIDDGVYANLVSAVYSKIKNNPLYCDDIMFISIDHFLANDYSKEKVEKCQGDELVKFVLANLEANKKTHYLLIPFNGARLSKNISFDKFSFIIGSEDEKVRKIIEISGLDSKEVKAFIEHTKKSRSKDFLNNPVLIMRIDDIHSNVYRNAAETAKKIFQITKLMIFNSETEASIYELTSDFHEDNYHVAIMGEESWQYGHGNWWNLIKCKYSLDFLEIDEFQKVFCTLVELFIGRHEKDELFDKFQNALDLFERSLEQEENYRDTTLSLLILFAGAESLLTEGKNEKSLRLSIIWPRLVTIQGKDQKELCRHIKDVYEKRNDFVHGGNVIYDCEPFRLRVLQQMLAKLIMLYIDEAKWKKNEVVGEKPVNTWNKYINSVFEEAVYQ